MILNSWKSQLEHYLRILVRPGDRVHEIDPMTDLPQISSDAGYTWSASGQISPTEFANNDAKPGALTEACDFVLVNSSVHFWTDIQLVLSNACREMGPASRLIVVYYSSLWRPLIALATWIGVRAKRADMNWLAPSDIRGIADLAGFELVRDEAKILVPFSIPLLSSFANRYVAPLPLINGLNLLRIAVLRPRKSRWSTAPSVSVVVPARNEAGNIQAILSRIPLMGPQDELIFVEGHSSDGTWMRIVDEVAQETWQDKWSGRITCVQQAGKGKGDAVRLGFSLAKNDVLMILDADLTVSAEELPKFYRALVDGVGEFVNGSRLVYAMDKRAMRFFNILGNKFFAGAFSFVLQARFKDTLCGTKVMQRQDYLRLARNRGFFGDFDPFGDFDLILGAVRMGLKVVEVPIRYKERTYGETNISRWRHGFLLLRMLIFSARRIRFT